MKDWRLHTLTTLKKLGVKPTKSMGQNFLIRYKVVHDIVHGSSINSDDHILEIGGGLGILTEAILAKTDNLTIIERDPILAKYLERTYPDINVIQGDALKVPWPENVKVVANLPYSISSPIIEKILHSKVGSATIMIQKELADRCILPPGSPLLLP